jgi:hypothetical protein
VDEIRKQKQTIFGKKFSPYFPNFPYSTTSKYSTALTWKAEKCLAAEVDRCKLPDKAFDALI